jgi:acyl-CoA dehydrogenase
MLDFTFTDEQEMLRDTVRKFMQKEVSLDFVHQIDEKEEFPDELWQKMVSLGWTGLPFPEEYGGYGGSVIDQAMIINELSRGLFVSGFVYLLTTCFGGNTLNVFGTEEQKKKYLTGISSGKYRWALALTEPDGGTDILGSTKTIAMKDGASYVAKGQKVYISGADKADYFTLFARTDKNAEKHTKGFTLFIVDKKSPGIIIRKMKKLGVKACSACEVFFDDVRIPEENVIGQVGNGWYHLTDTLNNERITVAAFCLGNAQGALDYAVKYAKERRAFGKALGEIQVLQHRLADVYMEIEMAQLMLYKAAWLQANRKPVAVEGTMAKIACSEVSFKAAEVGMRLMAGAGYMMEYPMQRYYRDAVLFLTAPISNDAGKNLIGQSLGFGRAY